MGKKKIRGGKTRLNIKKKMRNLWEHKKLGFQKHTKTDLKFQRQESLKRTREANRRSLEGVKTKDRNRKDQRGSMKARNPIGASKKKN